MSKTIEISDETFEKIKDQLSEDERVELDNLDDLVGKNFFFRTVTYHLLGKVVKKIGKWVQLEEAVWVGDSGRFMDFIKKGIISERAELEPVGTVFVNLDTVTDFFPWKHKIPKEQK